MKPLNLISEALNLLTATTPQCVKATALCMHYKAGCMGGGVPDDEDVLEHVERFLAAEGHALRLIPSHVGDWMCFTRWNLYMS